MMKGAFDRRQVMGGLGGLGMIALTQPAFAGQRVSRPAHNPIANPDQRAAEEMVDRLWAMDAVQAARRRVEANFAIAHGSEIPDEARPGFESAMDEFAANYLFKAAACDPNASRFVRLFMPPHHWFGRDVRGARMGGDNPDNVYRVAGIGHGARYRVTGQVAGEAAPSISLTLVANWGTSMTVQTLMFQDLERAADGSFEISIDDTPAAGRRNHMTTSPDVRFLFVRDSLSNWESQTPLDLSIECLRPTGAPLSEEARGALAARHMVEEVPLYFWFSRMFSALAPNIVSPPTGRASFGGLVRQTSGRAMLALKPDEAFVVTFDPAGAAYSALALHNWWFQSIDAHRRQSSLTADSALRNADGSVTCVVAATDPGVANWIDTGGLQNVQLLCRWQGMRDPVPAMRGELVRLDKLDRGLPRMTPAERRQQIAARQAAFNRRLLES